MKEKKSNTNDWLNTGTKKELFVKKNTCCCYIDIYYISIRICYWNVLGAYWFIDYYWMMYPGIGIETQDTCFSRNWFCRSK